MEFVPASAASVAAFVGVVAFVLAAAFAGIRYLSASKGLLSGRQARWGMAGVAIWLGASTVFTASGIMPILPLSGFPFFFGSVILAALLFSLSSVGRAFSAGIPLAALVAFQGFRFPLELVLHSWAAQGTVPETMTWTGQNIDIVSGLVALAAAPFASRSRATAWFANAVGIVLLVNVARVALLSAPVPFGWNLERPLLVAFHLPYSWIGSICVAGAIAGHVILTRALLMGGARGSGATAKGR